MEVEGILSGGVRLNCVYNKTTENSAPLHERGGSQICTEVGLSTEFVLLGSDVEATSDDQLADASSGQRCLHADSDRSQCTQSCGLSDRWCESLCQSLGSRLVQYNCRLQLHCLHKLESGMAPRP